MAETYIVADGDWLLKIAQDHGFRTQQPLLDANPDLNDRYGINPNILPPGLEIQIPDLTTKTERIDTGRSWQFVAATEVNSFCFTLQDADGSPLIGWTCDLTIGDQTWSALQTDANGQAVVDKIPKGATDGQLEIWPPNDGTDTANKSQTITLILGSLNPIDEGDVGRRAIQKILTNLRFYDGPIDGNLDGNTRAAILAFQYSEGLGGDGGPSGLADDEFCQRLVAAQGNLMPPPIAPEGAGSATPASQVAPDGSSDGEITI